MNWKRLVWTVTTFMLGGSLTLLCFHAPWYGITGLAAMLVRIWLCPAPPGAAGEGG
jgi:hypothetical protein